MAKTRSFVSGATPWVLLALTVLTLVVFAPVRHHDFVSFDDPLYVSENPHVARGLTPSAVAWAFTSGYAANWHPLTWLSHMLDVQVFGLAPGPHHLVNLFLHTANVLLLFALLTLATGHSWPSAFVAALFAVHPLHVESVAWVAERKDVLSTFFGLLAMLAYVWWAGLMGRLGQVGRVGRVGQMGRVWHLAYLMVVLLYAISLMAKPMLVTLPLVLLLLDVWPLGRVGVGRSESPRVRESESPKVRESESPGVRTSGGRTPGRTRYSLSGIRYSVFGIRPLIVEKLPFVALAIGSTIATVLVQQRGGAVSRLAVVPLPMRVANALTSCVTYVAEMLWPARLSVFYRYPDTFSIVGVLGAALIVSAVSVLVLRQLRTRPYLAVGWFWYLVTLAPVVGIVQVGRQAMADRYTYVPLVGLFVMVAWGVPDLVARWRLNWRALSALATAVVLLCAATARAQVAHWRNSDTLWRHALEVDPRNYYALNALGTQAMGSGRLDTAVRLFAQAADIAPDFPDARHNLGLAYAKQGQTGKAIKEYRAALALNPDVARTHDTLGMALLASGRTDEAIAEFDTAIRLEPELATARSNLGKALASKGDLDAAIACYTEALRLDPRLIDAHNNLGVVLVEKGRPADAIAHYREALRLDPHQPDVRSNLGVALDAVGRREEAVVECTAAVTTKPDSAGLHYNLGVVLAGQGRTADATAQFVEAVRLQPDLAQAHTHLALALASQGQLTAAIEHFEQAARLQPASDTAHQYLGLTLAGAGRFPEAIVELREALRLNPRNEAAARGLAMAVERAGARTADRK
jgi:tetratricopeptide (TPR) repeat protein